MNKKAVYSILSMIVAMVVLSVSLVFAIGPRVSADEGEIAVMEGDQYFNITGSVITNYMDDWISEEGREFLNQHDKIKLVIPEGVVALDGWEYDGSRNGIISSGAEEKIFEIVLPQSLRRIGVAALAHFTNIRNIEIPEGVTSIKRFAFSSCGITSIKLPSTLVSIDNGAFEECPFLTTVFIPKSVVDIESGAFYHSIYEHTFYQFYVDGDWYKGYYNLTTIYCEADEKPAGWNDDWLYDDNDHENKVEVVWGYKPQGANNDEEQNNDENNSQNENTNDVPEITSNVVNNNNDGKVKIAAVTGVTSGVAGIVLGIVFGIVIAKRRRK